MMAGMASLQRELARLSGMTMLSSVVDDVDKIIDLLAAAREQVAAAPDPHTASLTMTKLQNPIKEGFEAINEDLRKVSKVQKDLGKALDKSFPSRPLPTDSDAMADYPELINRAIAMHLLREGQFGVASTFIDEAKGDTAHIGHPVAAGSGPTTADAEMHEGTGLGASHPATDFSSLHSEELQYKFANMYDILSDLRSRNLMSAIEWARQNSEELEARGSNLEFELSKLQFVWLFKGLGAPEAMVRDDEISDQQQQSMFGGAFEALAYARQHFSRFQARHLREIQQLASALVFAPNLAISPYASIFESNAAFNEVAASFTREFCSLLGLSAESPLYVAATAGAVALPRLMKYVAAMRSKHTEWTTANELAFETPLPRSMIYHSIFVCPVSKEQTTDANPPMMLPCGHVLASDSLRNLVKAHRFKCPYCPSEAQLKDARQIIL